MIVLASASPRRAELLTAAGYRFVVRPVEVDESLLPDETPVEAVRRLSFLKADLADAAADEVVLAADTLVTVDGEILGKPVDEADARRMLRRLSGRAHDVLTGVTCRRGTSVQTEVVDTRVWMTAIDEDDLARYLATGEPADKAGAYGIQGFASRFVTRIEGSYSNVVGLPVATVAALLRTHGVIC
jgi:septum formation protein